MLVPLVRSMKAKDTGPSIKRSLLGLLVLICALRQSYGEDSSPKVMVKDFMSKVGADFECYVCNSMVERCDTSPYKRLKCNADGYMKHVYGDMSTHKDMELSQWPPSLTEAAAADPEAYPGWMAGVNGSFASTYKGHRIETYSKNRFSGFTSLYDSYKKFKSCRKMRIWADNQKNDGRNQEIPETKPRIIRTCSFVDSKGLSDTFNDKGCRTITTKTATVEVCYCKNSDPAKPCNGASYLRMSQYYILAASLLVFVAKIGMNTHS